MIILVHFCQIKVLIYFFEKNTFEQLCTGASQKNCIFSCNSFQKLKLSYILDSLHVKSKTLKKNFFLILMIRAWANESQKSVSQNIRIFYILSFIKWPSIQYKFWVLLFFETTIMANTAVLAMIQKTNIHWHSPQRGYVTDGHYWKGWLFKECCIKEY